MRDILMTVARFLRMPVSVVGTPLGIDWGSLLFLFVLPVIGIYLLIRLIAFFV